MWIFIAAFTIGLSYLALKIIDYRYFWQRRGIPNLKPWPIVGNSQDVILKRRNLSYLIEDFYKLFPGKRYYGMHQFNVASILVKDLALIKRIAIKDFDHFVDHIVMVNLDMEPMLRKNLFALTGQKWKDMRATLSPSFSGNKIRIMFVLMSECAKQFNEHFLEQNKDVIEVEMKELTGRLSTDIIATCAFGVKCDSIKDKDGIFYKMARAVTANSASMWIYAIVQTFLPSVAKRYNLKVISSEISTFFDDVIRGTLRARKEQNIIRPDMIHLLMEAMRHGKNPDHQTEQTDAGFAAVDEYFLNDPKTNSHSNKTEVTVEDIVCHAFLFFLAGFETVSVLLSHCLHELAINPEIQKKLQEEIDQVFEECNGDLDYESVVNMKYLDMVISETLRKWPPASSLNRVCVKDFIIEADPTHNEEAFTLKKGEGVLIPVHGIHRDPKYYPDPEKFDPERFNEENRYKLVPYTYLPFGLGPRNCIGSRFALLESKTLLTYILSKFDVVPTSKTENPLKLNPGSTSPCPKGFWLGLKKR